MATASGRTEAGGAKYHTLKATETWKRFRASEDTHASATADERHRTDERRMRADLSVRAAEQ